MPKIKDPEILRRKERVKAAVDLRGVPEGTEGRVLVRNGIDWIRYWVSFDNGVDMGSLGRDKLVRVKDWDTYLVEREKAAQAAEEEPEADVGSEESAAAPDTGGGGGGGVTVNGVPVPQLLIDRTKAALERRGVTR